ncbi:bifunctional 2',3'-cyclic-nucleotide 2'-phosphodiesterase/3'-nucleotidase [Ketogulonicigenium vulgare]|uniref:bifunctional 2',3'-cyclic-nucleotide 2'-phosphodiesterase/3'-nucleotidase n=1 Tax=Ketogulonicigenium vulgare TaxID=92945 RepID=UPI0001E68222|nr:bifunctional 2',3'-cyclic-nucleotide 2'-phosphodiesterase/3'-nucleotidase [Ketogulonicigenium vulgare]ADO42280.1 2',3'-cyclic nucleotide 2'-phosphodiesterase/3'-nucleotidase bifunctional periplasmic precursor protein [Ketogulonicigenium vulgare Y25]ALJ80662.1 2', 3'-cyclic nucleotide 2'-phosphodiesterase [Ketogulonicigenium vulgare]ANW33474.1 2',3'-cyclic-nucleotide 2'-phosphodiesterase [Ketogulonicigenium vulgare]AOZ54193.1 putative 2',3'-cyclic-nucleotide 2'-phosphodiesterase [Ketogulonici
MTFRLSRRHFLATTGATLAVMHPFSVRAASNQAHLRIMETTDLHVHVYPYDYYADRAIDTAGLSRTASLIEGIRAEAANSILFDNGDMLQGNPLGDYIAYERGMEPGQTHPIINAMNTLDYAAGTLGNHEFNYGLPFLANALAGSGFPVVCANAITSAGESPLEDVTLVAPYVILDREMTLGDGSTLPLRIGVIGFVPPQITAWDKAHLDGNVTARGIVEAAEAYVPQMKAEGAEIIIALCHSGIGEVGADPAQENAAIPLAAIEGIDVLLLGHSHRVFPGPDYEGTEGVDASAGTIGGKPAVMAGFWGSHMGLVDLMLEHDGTAWAIARAEVEARPITARDAENRVTAAVGDVAAVQSAARVEHEATLAYVRRAVGQTSAPLYSYFALVADDPSVQIVSQAQLWYVADLLRGTEYEGLPLLSAAAPFKAGGRGGPDYYTDVPAGDIAIRNVADLYLYPNTVQAVLITGAQLKGWLERSAGMFNQITPGASDALLLNPDFPSYNFDVIDGVTYQIDLSQPAMFDRDGAVVSADTNRIVNLQWNGAPVDPAQQFVVASNNYRASGGGSFPGADGSTIILVAPDTNRDALVRYIVDQGTINPSADGNWRFAPMEGTTVIFETGPRAIEYADQVQGLTITHIGPAEGGFSQFRINL